MAASHPDGAGAGSSDIGTLEPGRFGLGSPLASPVGATRVELSRLTQGGAAAPRAQANPSQSQKLLNLTFAQNDKLPAQVTSLGVEATVAARDEILDVRAVFRGTMPETETLPPEITYTSGPAANQFSLHYRATLPTLEVISESVLDERCRTCVALAHLIYKIQPSFPEVLLADFIFRASGSIRPSREKIDEYLRQFMPRVSLIDILWNPTHLAPERAQDLFKNVLIARFDQKHAHPHDVGLVGYNWYDKDGVCVYDRTRRGCDILIELKPENERFNAQNLRDFLRALSQMIPPSLHETIFALMQKDEFSGLLKIPPEFLRPDVVKNIIKEVFPRSTVIPASRGDLYSGPPSIVRDRGQPPAPSIAPVGP